MAWYKTKSITPSRIQQSTSIPQLQRCKENLIANEKRDAEFQMFKSKFRHLNLGDHDVLLLKPDVMRILQTPPKIDFGSEGHDGTATRGSVTPFTLWRRIFTDDVIRKILRHAATIYDPRWGAGHTSFDSFSISNYLKYEAERLWLTYNRSFGRTPMLIQHIIKLTRPWRGGKAAMGIHLYWRYNKMCILHPDLLRHDITDNLQSFVLNPSEVLWIMDEKKQMFRGHTKWIRIIRGTPCIFMQQVCIELPGSCVPLIIGMNPFNWDRNSDYKMSTMEQMAWAFQGLAKHGKGGVCVFDSLYARPDAFQWLIDKGIYFFASVNKQVYSRIALLLTRDIVEEGDVATISSSIETAANVILEQDNKRKARRGRGWRAGQRSAAAGSSSASSSVIEQEGESVGDEDGSVDDDDGSVGDEDVSFGQFGDEYGSFDDEDGSFGDDGETATGTSRGLNFPERPETAAEEGESVADDAESSGGGDLSLLDQGAPTTDVPVDHLSQWVESSGNLGSAERPEQRPQVGGTPWESIEQNVALKDAVDDENVEDIVAEAIRSEPTVVQDLLDILIMEKVTLAKQVLEGLLAEISNHPDRLLPPTVALIQRVI